MVRIALATCSTLPDWEVDDRPLESALRRRGARLARPAWDDPRFDWGSCDACLIRTTWDYETRRRDYVAWARRTATATRLFNPPEIVAWNTHKSYLRDLEARGVPLIPTVWLEAGQTVDVPTLLADRGWRRGLFKPLVGHTARATLRFDDSAEGLAAARRHLDAYLPDEPMMLQPYLESVELQGELSVIFIDGELSHAVRKVPVSGDYRVQDDFGAHDEPVELAAEDLDLARSIVATVDADLLYARVDMLRDGRGRLRLTELELVEPSLFFRHAPAAADRLSEALLARISMAES